MILLFLKKKEGIIENKKNQILIFKKNEKRKFCAIKHKSCRLSEGKHFWILELKTRLTNES